MRKDGARFWANTWFRRCRQRKDLIGFSVVARDLTERSESRKSSRERKEASAAGAELEQQLIASGRLVSLGELAASMAHEFNNPLGIVMGFTQQLLSEFEPNTPNHQALKIIDEETKRCERIIQELLQYSRPKNADLCPTDVKQAIDKTMNMVANRLYKQKIETRAMIADDLPLIPADPQQLEQVLINLFLNAIDAMPKGGNLEVEAALKATPENTPSLVITVIDSGSGIDQEDLAKVFQPFFPPRKAKVSASASLSANGSSKITAARSPWRACRARARR